MIQEADNRLYTFVVERALVTAGVQSPMQLGDGAGAEAEVPLPPSGGEVLLNHPEVSRNHATISYRATSKTWAIRDDCSLNGTFLARRKIAKGVDYQIDIGTEIIIGGQKPGLATGSKLPKMAPQAFCFVLERA
jgi:hypothetical protein